MTHQLKTTPREAHREYRRRTLRQIVLPVGIAAALILIGVPLFLLATMGGRQVGTVAAFMTFLIMLPLTLLCMLPYALMVALILLMMRGQHVTRRGLRTGYRLAYGLNRRSRQLSWIVSRPVVSAGKRLAWLERATGGHPPHVR